MTILSLTKLVSLFVYPLGAAILIGATALVLSFTNWWRIGRVLFGCALAALWIAATPIFANWLNWRLESQVPSVSLESLPQSDAVILLGGTPVGRIMHALRVYRAGKAPVIVITGGNPPWQKAGVPEALRVADFLIEIGAPRAALILETRSRNTRENAVNTAVIFKEHGWQHGLLITEGVNMPRALAAFRQVGLDVTPAVTGVRAGPLQRHNLLDFLPSVEALSWTTSAIKEIIGLRYYHYRGWA
jgi:uncharacterized SAM-binding protein YcdF (DUF218 family)